MSREPASVSARNETGRLWAAIDCTIYAIRSRRFSWPKGRHVAAELGLTKPTTTLQWYADWLPGTQKA